MPPRIVNIDLITTSYRIAGEIPLGNSGVLGTLADSNFSFIEVRAAKMARIHQANKLNEEPGLVRVVKSQIIACCVNKREEAAPTIAMRGGYTRVYKYPVRITSTAYDVQGMYEWGGRFDFTAMMAEGSCPFITLFDATVGAILFPTLLIQSPVVIFNRTYIQTMVLEGESSS